MRLLLDTHVLLWWLAGHQSEVHRVIADPGHWVSVSAASIWEASIKRRLGKLTIDGDLVESVRADGFDELAISSEHADLAGSLPMHHRDPFDRMLIAQAMSDDLTIVTRDPAFAPYEVQTIPG